ncbi:hypothetical protein [Leuconostoc mesenteroides]|uniref:hypothetical protein n=1 Tax=Leuconostoc mesenteroides TaxID=1245 RepID=UPI00235FABE9|nr:hypothetical protein [Leuconostoc mesenteroides]
MELSDRIGNNEWCQSCLKRRVNNGYSQCLFCQRKMTKETIDYYKVGYKDGFAAEEVNMITFDSHKADEIEKQQISKVPEKSKYDYATGFLDGKNEYQDQSSMDAAFGFDF